jgi:hypothetical protein
LFEKRRREVEMGQRNYPRRSARPIGTRAEHLRSIEKIVIGALYLVVMTMGAAALVAEIAPN